MILLLPMLPHFMPQFIEDFIAKLNYCIFSFSFLYDFISLKLFNIQFSLSYNQPTYYIDLMNIKSGSTLINIQGNLITLLQIASLHLTILILHYFIRHKQNLPWYLRWVRRLKEFMTFGVYIQYATSSCLLMCLISSTEIQRFDFSNTTNKFKLLSLTIFSISIVYIKFKIKLSNMWGIRTAENFKWIWKNCSNSLR